MVVLVVLAAVSASAGPSNKTRWGRFEIRLRHRHAVTATRARRLWQSRAPAAARRQRCRRRRDPRRRAAPRRRLLRSTPEIHRWCSWIRPASPRCRSRLGTLLLSFGAGFRTWLSMQQLLSATWTLCVPASPSLWVAAGLLVVLSRRRYRGAWVMNVRRLENPDIDIISMSNWKASVWLLASVVRPNNSPSLALPRTRPQRVYDALCAIDKPRIAPQVPASAARPRSRRHSRRALLTTSIPALPRPTAIIG